ncbi:MAG: hypothetical protein MZV63_49860 [Marinilabiliales bacterium]|nr:hypothetical protein [Marinilabiliales bacterium]
MGNQQYKFDYRLRPLPPPPYERDDDPIDLDADEVGMVDDDGFDEYEVDGRVEADDPVDGRVDGMNVSG